MPNTPIVNAPYLDIDGLDLSYTSAKIITMIAGRARNSTNENDIILNATATLNGNNLGANGVDIAAIVATSLYAVYVIGDSTGYKATAGLLSLNFTSPSLPGGYDMFRRIGAVSTDGSANIRSFKQTGDDADRMMWYRDGVATSITSGSSATFAAINLALLVPPVQTEVLFLVAFTPTAAADKVALRATTSGSTNGQAILSGSVAGVATTDMLWCECNATPSIDYKVTGSATAVSVMAYKDVL